MPKVVTPLLLEERRTQQIEVLEGAEVLSVEFTRNRLTMYALVDPSVKSKEFLTVRVRGSGEDASDVLLARFLGTVVLAAGGATLHVWLDNERMKERLIP